MINHRTERKPLRRYPFPDLHLRHKDKRARPLGVADEQAAARDR
jgi:hypothetical protein